MGREDDDEGRKFGVSRKIMLAAIGSLLGVVMLIILLHIYARYLLRRQERRRRAALIYSQRTQVTPIDEISAINEPPKSSGLDPLVIASLPTFTYRLTASSQIDDHDEPTECSVCLGNITDESTVRLLPNCKHMFHVECIDTWLGSHTTCPICRTVAEPAVQPEDMESGTRVQPTAPPIEENAFHSAAQVAKEGEPSSSSSSGSRFGSFRRMLGRDRSSSRITHSCGDEVGTEDLERR
ncbi:E3 ubiquitin-protein ligase ATL41-like [Herrania umbratica]|uniref:RING-type E3 ubiquitin transferase n=1 Tax=Herrania umbratica TaxID=108875 RepID=A0A6J1B6B0_9ROSI|nr:E3 ubiquitin-protein ligase ATL41-like [Herrania umbratica]